MLLVKDVCKRCIYEYMRAYHIDVVNGGYASWLKRHARDFDKWFEETFGKSRKIPCPRQAEEWAAEASVNLDRALWKKINGRNYKPLQHWFQFGYVNKPPETCKYALEHLVSRNVNEKEIPCTK